MGLLALFCHGAGMVQSVHGQDVVGIYREVFTGITGVKVSDLTNAVSFPSGATSSSVLTYLFETPSNGGDNYGQRLRAVMVAPYTGDYTFYLSGDDQSLLYLSQNESPAEKLLIAAEMEWNGPRDFTGTVRRTNAAAFFPAMNLNLPANRSDHTVGTIHLAAGQRCYTEVLMKEGLSADNLAVAWTRPNGSGGFVFEGPIPASHFRAVGAPPPIVVPPASFTATVDSGTAAVTVDYNLHPIRSANFGVLVQQADGSFAGFTMPSSRIYIGTVQGNPGALAVGLLKENGNLFTKVAFENGVEWSSAVGLTFVRGGTNWMPAWPTSTLGAGGAGSVVYEAELGIDLAYKYYVDTEMNVRNAVEMAEYSVMSANLAFVRDAGILHTVGKVVVRANQVHCPYFPLTSHNQWLNEMLRQWNEVLPVGVSHDLALVATTPGGEGLAWLGVVGTGARYSSNGADSTGDFSGVWRHEAGHNWGANHYEGGGNPEGDTLMSNNSLYRFSSSELVPMIAHRDSRLGVFNNLGNYAVPLPPRANQDRAIVSPDPAATVTIDVMANDSDANGDPLTIQSFDATTFMGRAVRRSVGTGPGGRDQLTYSATTALVSGTDWFSYRIVDTSGRTATSWVMLRPGIHLNLTRNGASLILNWSGGQAPYQIQRSTDLSQPNSWQNVGSPVQNNSLSLPIGPGNLFLRVRVP